MYDQQDTKNKKKVNIADISVDNINLISNSMKNRKLNNQHTKKTNSTSCDFYFAFVYTLNCSLSLGHAA